MSYEIERYDNVSSGWLDYIDRSDRDWDGMIVSVVHYTNQQGYTNGELFFWTSIDDYEELVNGGGSVYKAKWEKGKMEWYTGQEPDDEEDEDYDDYDDDYNSGGGYSGGYVGGDIPAPIKDDILEPPTSKKIDGRTLRAIKYHQEIGDFDEWADDKFGEEHKKDIIDWASRMEDIEELLERSERIRELISTEQLTTKKMFKVVFRDIEEFLGVSFEQQARYMLLKNVGLGKLNPNQFIKYKFMIKEIYDAMEKEGIRGASKIGQRWISAKNPLIRNRYAYKGKEVAKQLARNKGIHNWYEGEEAIEQIRKYHKKILKEQARGFIKHNSYALDKRIVEKGGKKVLQVKWSKQVSKPRRLITLSKKALRIAKWFVI